MRRFLLSGVVLVSILLNTNPLWAQEGVAIYSHSSKILSVKGPADATVEIITQQEGGEISDDGPGYAVESRTLAFNRGLSLMYPTEVESFEIGGRPHWEYIDTTFVDLEEGTYSQWIDFDAEAYLVKGRVREFPWRLTNETRLYLDYRVTKATALVDSAVVEAWFAPDIPVSVGPGLYGGLPGLILQ